VQNEARLSLLHPRPARIKNKMRGVVRAGTSVFQGTGITPTQLRLQSGCALYRNADGKHTATFVMKRSSLIAPQTRRGFAPLRRRPSLGTPHPCQNSPSAVRPISLTAPTHLDCPIRSHRAHRRRDTSHLLVTAGLPAPAVAAQPSRRQPFGTHRRESPHPISLYPPDPTETAFVVLRTLPRYRQLSPGPCRDYRLFPRT